MKVLCLISYTDPDGERYEAGQLYQVEAEVGLWLTMAAEGQFKVIEDGEPQDVNNDADRALEQLPADRMVRRSPRTRGK